MKNIACAILLTTLFVLHCGFSCYAHAEAPPPYKPSPEQIELLKEVIPNFPEQPPMGATTTHFQEKFVISQHRPGMFKYYLYVPEGYNPDEQYSAILLLHNGAREMEAATAYLQLGLDKAHKALLIVPIAPPGYDWNSAAPLALEALQDVAKNHKLHPKRLYVSGYAMGAIGTYSMISRYKGIFAAAFAVCGTWDPAVATDFDDIPLRIFHAEQDETFPLMITSQINTELKKAGRRSGLIVEKNATHADCAATYQTQPYWDWLLKQEKK